MNIAEVTGVVGQLYYSDKHHSSGGRRWEDRTGQDRTAICPPASFALQNRQVELFNSMARLLIDLSPAALDPARLL